MTQFEMRAVTVLEGPPDTAPPDRDAEFGGGLIEGGRHVGADPPVEIALAGVGIERRDIDRAAGLMPGPAGAALGPGDAVECRSAALELAQLLGGAAPPADHREVDTGDLQRAARHLNRGGPVADCPASARM